MEARGVEHELASETNYYSTNYLNAPEQIQSSRTTGLGPISKQTFAILPKPDRDKIARRKFEAFGSPMSGFEIILDILIISSCYNIK